LGPINRLYINLSITTDSSDGVRSVIAAIKRLRVYDVTKAMVDQNNSYPAKVDLDDQTLAYACIASAKRAKDPQVMGRPVMINPKIANNAEGMFELYWNAKPGVYYWIIDVAAGTDLFDAPPTSLSADVAIGVNGRQMPQWTERIIFTKKTTSDTFSTPAGSEIFIGSQAGELTTVIKSITMDETLNDTAIQFKEDLFNLEVQGLWTSVYGLGYTGIPAALLTNLINPVEAPDGEPSPLYAISKQVAVIMAAQIVPSQSAEFILGAFA